MYLLFSSLLNKKKKGLISLHKLKTQSLTYIFCPFCGLALPLAGMTEVAIPHNFRLLVINCCMLGNRGRLCFADGLFDDSSGKASSCVVWRLLKT